MDPHYQGAPGYPAAPGYPPTGPAGYPPQGSGYPAPGGYPGQPGSYPPAAGVSGYPPQQPGGYPPTQGYPPSQGYPPTAAPVQAQFGASTGNKQFIPGGLTPGRLINITLTPGPKGFAINLRHSDNGDIAFHFNPRLNDHVVVRNTCINGGWQSEERQQPSFPFVAGQQCNILILAEANQFKVAVNGQHFTEYRLRTGGLQLIQVVEVTSDATVGSLYIQ